MGVQGLKRLLSDRYGRAVSQVNVNAERAAFDHVLIDTNSLLHACVGRASLAETLAAVVEELERVITAAAAAKTLVIVVDGPAPLAKIPLQRGRRRQVGLTTQQTEMVTKLHITPGTEFMGKLTAVLAHWAVLKMSEAPGLTVYLSGSDVPGEGETKLFSLLEGIIREARDTAGTDSVEDSICIVGNDTDLVLGCLCMCRAVNLTVLDASQGTAVSTGDLISTWLAEISSSAPGSGKGFIANTAHLPAARLAFSLIQMFAGNDYLPAVEGADPHALWCAYTALDPAYRSLVNPVTFGIDVPSMTALLRAALHNRKDGGKPRGGYGVEMPPDQVKRYFEGLMWCLAGLCGHGCVDYGWELRPSSKGSSNDLGPTVFDLIKYCEAKAGGGGKKGKAGPRKGGAKGGVIASKASITDASVQPPPPLKYLGCVVPPEAWWLVSRSAHALANQGTGKKRKRGDEEVELALATLSGGAAPQDVIGAVSAVYARVAPPLSRDPRMRVGAGFKLTPRGAAPGAAAGGKKKKQKQPQTASPAPSTAHVDPALLALPSPVPPPLRKVTAKLWATVDVAALPPHKAAASASDAVPQAPPGDMRAIVHPYTGLSLPLPAPAAGAAGGRPSKKRKTGIELDAFLSMDIEV